MAQILIDAGDLAVYPRALGYRPYRRQRGLLFFREILLKYVLVLVVDLAECRVESVERVVASQRQTRHILVVQAKWYGTGRV